MPADATTESRLEPLRSGPTLAEEAAAQVRAQILAGRIEPGERLVEAQLARSLGVSRGTVREALALLRAEQLVEEVPRRGTFVTTLSARDVEEIFELRAALESTALRLAIDRDPDALVAQLSAIVTQMRAAAKRKDRAELSRLDVAFHACLCEAGGNRRIADAFHTQMSLVGMLVALESREPGVSEPAVARDHDAIVKRIRSGDPATAQAALLGHLEDAKLRLVARALARREAARP